MEGSIFNTSFTLDNRKIGDEAPCFVIAEAGVAHFGSVDLARSLVDMAVEARADAVKFQVYETERLVSTGAPAWIARLKSKELPHTAFGDLKAYSEAAGIMFLATAHEEYSADFLDELGVPAYKVGSGEVSNLPFLRHLAGKGKPLLISTGLHDMAAIEAAINVCADVGNRDLALFHCVTAYPTPYEESNLRVIPAMQARFGVPVGYSDHTIGYEVPLAAVALGASLVEKHICLDKRITGSQDCRVACERDELAAFVAGVRRIEAALGSADKNVTPSALKSLDWARKSLVAARPLGAGHVLVHGDLMSKRPGTGIPPDAIDNVLGRVLRRAIAADEMIQSEDLE